jgi:hypothetical protein
MNISSTFLVSTSDSFLDIRQMMGYLMDDPEDENYKPSFYL